jgi:hypothetical protein
MEQLKDLFDNIWVGALMGAVLWTMTLLRINDVLLLAIQCVVGILLFFLCSELFKIESYTYIKNIVAELFKKNKK